MRICYVGKHNDAANQDEKHVATALTELGHEVILRHQAPKVDIPENTDVVLANHWYEADIDWLKTVEAFKCVWYWDKVWNNRDKWMARISPALDRIFLSDGTFAKGKPKFTVLRQGYGHRMKREPIIRDYGCDIAFLGSMYGKRVDWYMDLKKRYQGRIRHFTGIHGDQLEDLCHSIPIIVAPPFPSDDHYWSNRIYLIMGAGGFILHPKLEGLTDYEDGVHCSLYTDDIVEKIEYWLKHPKERELVRKQGKEKTRKDYSYKERCRKLIEAIRLHKNIGTRG